MAYFYLTGVIRFGPRNDAASLHPLSTAQKFVTVDWIMLDVHGNAHVVPLAEMKYSDHIIDVKWADEFPRLALVRTDKPLEAGVGDYFRDMTDESREEWLALYRSYPLLSSDPFLDAPFKPGD